MSEQLLPDSAPVTVAPIKSPMKAAGGVSGVTEHLAVLGGACHLPGCQRCQMGGRVWRKFCCFMRRIETEQNDKPYVLIDAQAVLGFLGRGGIEKTWFPKWLPKQACFTCRQIARRIPGAHSTTVVAMLQDAK